MNKQFHNFINRQKSNLMCFKNVYIRSLSVFFKHKKGKNTKRQIEILGIIRERNEAEILKDTLDHLAGHVDGIIVLDDASTDESAKVAQNHPAVLEVIIKKTWRKESREWEETADRNTLVKRGCAYNPTWFFYADADERFEGRIKEFLKKDAKSVDGIRISLFDAYITKGDSQPYKPGNELMNFRKKFGIERRDILMIWRNKKSINFSRPDAREPRGVADNKIITKFFCQHYGKSLSIAHWEETCNYYIKYFPKYRDKWSLRLGHAIHEKSDFNTKLYGWEEVKSKGVRIN